MGATSEAGEEGEMSMLVHVCLVVCGCLRSMALTSASLHTRKQKYIGINHITSISHQLEGNYKNKGIKYERSKQKWKER